VTSERHAATVEQPKEKSVVAAAAEESTKMELTEATNLNLVKAPCKYSCINCNTIRKYVPSHSLYTIILQ
jgi:hypothetical protein